MSHQIVLAYADTPIIAGPFATCESCFNEVPQGAPLYIVRGILHQHCESCMRLGTRGFAPDKALRTKSTRTDRMAQTRARLIEPEALLIGEAKS